MRWLIAFLALAGMVAAALALREHYRTEASPCSINPTWDCGIVNKSSFAVIGGLHGVRGPEATPPSGSKKNIFSVIDEVPVADIGIAGYLLLLVLAVAKRWRLLAATSVPAFAFSCYLAYIEWHILGVWCIYCVISLGIITLITLLSLIALGMNWRKGPLQDGRST
jgi:vitamin-K-epoxide reductase (warfarin-sensitive)